LPLCYNKLDNFRNITATAIGSGWKHTNLAHFSVTWQTGYRINVCRSWCLPSIRPYFVCSGTKRGKISS